MDQFGSDLRYGLRLLLRSPVVSAMAILALALGTGANSAIFSIVNAVLLRPLPYGQPHRLFMLWETNLRGGLQQLPLSVPDLQDYGEQSSVCQGLAGFVEESFFLSERGEPERLQGTFVTGNFFDVLGVTPWRGRIFQPGEEGARTVVLSHGLWQRRFGADPKLVGESLTLSGASYTVIGIMPSQFHSPHPGDQLWVPISLDGSDRVRIPSVVDAEGLRNRSRRFLIVVARLKPNVEPRMAQAEMDVIARRLEERYPDVNKGIGSQLNPLSEQLVGKVRPALLVLLCAAGCVLLIACANVANLLLARANSRQKEMAVRSALGARPGRIFRQLLTESVLLALVGGALGLLLAFWVIRFLPTMPSLALPRLEEINLDISVLVFTLALSLIAGILFGLAPAFQASKADINDMLKENIRSSSGGPRQHQMRRLLVFFEVFLAQVLLITAGLLIKSFWSYQQVHPGFKPEGVLSLQVWLPAYYYPKEQQMAAFYTQILARLAVLPGVQSAGAISTLPLSGSNISWRYTVDGRPPAQPGEVLRANFRTASPDYFRTMGIALRSGRVFSEMDHEDAAGVVIINESMARRYWPAQNPLGRHLTIPSAGGISREIVGVVADVKHSSLDTDSGEEMYVPYRQKPLSFTALVVRTAANPQGLLPAVRSEILAVDKNLPIYEAKTLEQLLAESTSTPRLNALLLGTFATLALLLAAVGIYGVLSYSIGQRRHEIGIRRALGAQRGHILKLVVGPAFATALLGIACGLLAALALSKVLARVLFQVDATDVSIYAGTALLLIAVALVASLVPAHRSLRVPLIESLRYR